MKIGLSHFLVIQRGKKTGNRRNMSFHLFRCVLRPHAGTHQFRPVCWLEEDLPLFEFREAFCPAGDSL